MEDVLRLTEKKQASEKQENEFEIFEYSHKRDIIQSKYTLLIVFRNVGKEWVYIEL